MLKVCAMEMVSEENQQVFDKVNVNAKGQTRW